MYQYTCDHFGSRLEVSSPMTTGKCMNQKSGAWQQTRQANGGCSAHEKWGALR